MNTNKNITIAILRADKYEDVYSNLSAPNAIRFKMMMVELIASHNCGSYDSAFNYLKKSI